MNRILQYTLLYRNILESDILPHAYLKIDQKNNPRATHWQPGTSSELTFDLIKTEQKSLYVIHLL